MLIRSLGLDGFHPHSHPMTVRLFSLVPNGK